MTASRLAVLAVTAAAVSACASSSVALTSASLDSQGGGASQRPSSSQPTLAFSTSTSSTGTASATAPPCLISSLTASMSYAMPDGTHSYLTELRLTNAAESPCALQGHPSVAITLQDGSKLTAQGNAQLSQVITTREATPVPANQAVVVNPGDYAPFFVEIHTADVCDTAGSGQDSTWQIDEPGGPGTLTIVHVDTIACDHSPTYVTPFMQPGPSPTEASKFPTPTQSVRS